MRTREVVIPDKFKYYDSNRKRNISVSILGQYKQHCTDKNMHLVLEEWGGGFTSERFYTETEMYKLLETRVEVD